MTFREWRSLWRFDRTINIPELSITLMCPYFFVRLMWYTTSKEFRGWPNTLDSGLVIGWRWPFTRQFREKSWVWQRKEMAVVIYPTMDSNYTMRAASVLGWKNREDFTLEHLAQIGATARKLRAVPKPCGHEYWSAECSLCNRSLFNFAVTMVAKYEPFQPPDPNESPLAAFQRREAEAKKRLGVGQ